MVLVALGPLLGPGVDQLGVGLVAGAQRPLDHPGGVVEAAQHPGHVAPRRVRQLPLGQRLGRLALEVDDLPAVRRCAGSGRGAGRRGSAGRRGRRACETASNAARSVVGVLRQLGYDAAARRRAGRSSIAASSAAAAAGRVSEGKWSRRASCTSRSASPSRVDSPAKSPPESWACTSGSANSERTLASARSQPSLAVRRNCCSIASCSTPLRPPGRRRRASRRARRRDRSRPGSAPRAPSMSGFTPGVTLRNTFISASSPKATEELDCSPLNSVECASRSSSWPGSRWNRSPSSALGRRGVEGPLPQRHRLAVVQRVVGVHPAVVGVLPPADERVVEPGLGLLVERQRAPGRARSRPPRRSR